MGYLTNLLKNSVRIPNIPLREIIKTNSVATAYLKNDYQKVNKLLKKGKYYYKSIKFRENNNYSLLHQGIFDSNKNVLDIILNQPYATDRDVIEDVDNDIGFAPVHLACFQDSQAILQDLIVRGKSRISIKTMHDHLDLFHIASQCGSIRCLEYIHKNFHQDEVDLKSEENWSPLHFACFMNRMDICSYLIDHGADIYFRNTQFMTPLDCAILNDNFDLFVVLYNYHYDSEKLSLNDGPKVAKSVHIAASSKKGTRILDYLMSDPNNHNSLCNLSIRATPLHFACMQNNTKAVKAILRHPVNVNFKDYLGNTPLMYATEHGNLDVLRELIENGADALKKNNEGLNPIQIAIHQGNQKVKLYFLGLEKYKNFSQKDYM